MGEGHLRARHCSKTCSRNGAPRGLAARRGRRGWHGMRQRGRGGRCRPRSPGAWFGRCRRFPSVLSVLDWPGRRIRSVADTLEVTEWCAQMTQIGTWGSPRTTSMRQKRAAQFEVDAPRPRVARGQMGSSDVIGAASLGVDIHFSSCLSVCCAAVPGSAESATIVSPGSLGISTAS